MGLLESVLDLIKANSAVQQNACVGSLNKFYSFRYVIVLYRYIDKQHPVHATQVQDIRSSPGDELVNDGTKMAHDGSITPKPGLRKNKLVAKYGTNFRYLGVVKNGIDRVTVVTSIPIPRYENVKVKPINFAKCEIALGKDEKNKRYIVTADTQASKAAKEWCARAIPYIEYLKEQEKYYIEKVHELLCDDLYAVLPELKPTSGHLKSRNSHTRLDHPGSGKYWFLDKR